MSSAESWRLGGWIQTYTGRQFWPLSPQVEDIHMLDIAHSLALQCRYNGHTDRFYSVAEHCVLVSQAVAPEFAMWGLLHDAAEAYVGDMVRPLKRDMPSFRAAEDAILALIAEKWFLGSTEIPQAVHEADSRILLTERAELLSATKHRWDESLEALTPLDVKVVGLSPADAELAYIERFKELDR